MILRTEVNRWMLSLELFVFLFQGCDIQVRGQFEDPKVAAWLLDPGAKEMNLHRMITNCLPLHAHLLDGKRRHAQLIDGKRRHAHLLDGK